MHVPSGIQVRGYLDVKIRVRQRLERVDRADVAHLVTEHSGKLSLVRANIDDQVYLE